MTTVSQWRGKSTKQDTQTSPVLLATCEQITRIAIEYDNLVKIHNPSGKCSEGQPITISFLGFSHLAARFSEQERDLRDTLTWKERQQRAARAAKLEEENPGLRMQHISTGFLDSQDTLRLQLHVSRACERELHADLLAAEQEREILKSLVSTLEALDKKRREREGIVAYILDLTRPFPCTCFGQTCVT
jgi:hypothetical protein